MIESTLLISDRALKGQTVVVIGGTTGIGLETARRARAEGADVVVTARDADHVQRVGLELGASIAAFDATNTRRLARFFEELPPIDHVLISSTKAYDAALEDMDFDEAHRDVESQLWLILHVARVARTKIRPGGTLTFIGHTGARRPAKGLLLSSTLAAGLSVLMKNLALEIAPVRANCIAVGFVDVASSAAPVGDHLDARRKHLREILPIGRVVDPSDVAAMAVHLMTNTAVTGATYDLDGGEQLVEA